MSMINNILLTGGTGFIGTHICIALKSHCGGLVTLIDRSLSGGIDPHLDYVLIHAAGSHNPCTDASLREGNEGYAGNLISFLRRESVRLRKIVLISTTSASSVSEYGSSKRKVERIFLDFSKSRNIPLTILRFPRVFGPGSRPYTNSFVATVMHLASSKGEDFTFDLSSDDEKDFFYIGDAVRLIIGEVFNEEGGGIREVMGTFLKPSTVIARVKAWTHQIRQGYYFHHDSKIEKQLYAHLCYCLANGVIEVSGRTVNDDRGSYRTILANSNIRQMALVRISHFKERGNHYHQSKLELFSVIEGVVLFHWENLLSKESGCLTLTHEDEVSIIFPPFFLHRLASGKGKDSALLVGVNEAFWKENDDTLRFG